MSRKSVALILSLLSLTTLNAYAYQFQPSPAEWVTWSDYCKARYVETTIGKASSFRGRVSGEAIEKWKALIGHDTWLHMHHGCAGLIWILRAQRTSGKDEQAIAFALNRADEELNYTLERIPPSHSIHHTFTLASARLRYLRGDPASCFSLIENVLAVAPDYAEAYSVYSAYLYKEGEYKRAREVLERGMREVAEPTAEMHYFLGLILLRQDDYDAARVQAEEAYRLGYPLPGLRRKLQALGHWGA
jgi:tetratricopeptide (TPR) repeat protein